MPIAPTDLNGIPSHEGNLLRPNVCGDGLRLQDPFAGELVDAGGATAGSPEIFIRKDTLMPVGPGDVDLSILEPTDLDRGCLHVCLLSLPLLARVALKRALPEILGLAGEHPFPDRFDTREREDLAFRKLSERLEVLLPAIHVRLELLDLRVADPKHALVDRVVRCGQLAAEIEELVLEAPKHLVEPAVLLPSASRSSLKTRARPSTAFSSSIVPYAAIRGESFGTRLPPTSAVVPLSPVRV